jgi:hypothetical protein
MGKSKRNVPKSIRYNKKRPDMNLASLCCLFL